MADEFLEQDLEVPTEDDVDQCYGSKHLGVADVGNKKIRTKIVKVRKEDVNDQKTGRPKKKLVAYFESLEKTLVLNDTNKDILVDALGKPPTGWEGATVGVLVDPNVTYAGKRTGGVRLRVLLPPKPAPAPKPAPIPVKSAPAAAKAATDFPEEEDDPGFEPDAAFEPVS
jgi:hypothetical protein